MLGLELILCESSGNWAAALRRELPPAVRVVETRSLGELFSHVRESPQVMVAIELAPGREGPVMDALARLGREFPGAVPMVLADDKLRGWEFAAREAGAVHFIASTRRGSEVAAIAKRVAHRGGATSEGADSLEEQILSSLPWSG